MLDFLQRNGRAVWSLVLFAIALTLLLLLRAQSNFDGAGRELGPYFWPQLWLGVLLVLTAIDCSAELTKSHMEQRRDGNRRPPEKLSLIFIGTIFVAAYVVAIAAVGFPLATAIFLVAFAYLGGYRNLTILTLTALGTTIVLLYLFVRVVYISLPLGAGPFVEMNVALYRLLGIF